MYVILIEDELDEFTEQDMRRWWRGRCVKHVRNGEVLFEVGEPKRLNLWEGVKRFASFGIKTRVVRRKI
jgi:hypothetical protein